MHLFVYAENEGLPKYKKNGFFPKLFFFLRNLNLRKVDKIWDPNWVAYDSGVMFFIQKYEA